MAMVLAVTFFPSAIMIYVTMETDILAAFPGMVSALGLSYKDFKNVSILQNIILKPRQVHMHFYNPPEWFNKNNVFRGCPSNCSMSTGAKHFLNKDVVIFFGPRLSSNPVPKKRGQIWVLHGKEAPPNHAPMRKWKGLFNWTMTYRRDSDFPHLYGELRNVPNPSALLPNTTLKFFTVRNSTNVPKPTRNARSTAWFVSHCKTQSKRQEYVKTLQTTQSVDIFGACGTNRCARGRDHACLKPYKFYLSFENSLCRDYITEKVFKIYSNEHDIIPITRGIGDLYSLYLPPASFINSVDFNGIDQLGRFLNYVRKNETLYSEYFKWRTNYQARFDAYSSFCELCKRMHKPDVYTRYRRIYTDVHQWWFGSSDVKICTNPADLRR
ncbi:alpha-(1,3)-fucosyltransferase C-like isoform X2 [Pecten maximus]|nr:alpha-(1,3)-fucosyltransferase C-like isoform X2 [Pecten maximus]